MSKHLRHFEPIGGVLPDPIENAGKNWLFLGAEDIWEIVNAIGDWILYRSNPEKQATRYFDPYNCVTISLMGKIEKVLNKMMAENPAVRPILDMLGLIGPDGKADVSERYVAVGSGTIPGKGNSQYAVYQFVKNNGIVGEKHCPSHENMTQEEYFNIPNMAALKVLGKKLLEYILFEYKDVGESNDDLREALKRSPLALVVGGAYLGEESGALLYRNSGTPSYNHQLQGVRQDRNVEILGEKIPVIHKIEDSYEPFDKDYAGTYPFAYAKIIRLTLKKKVSMFRLAKTASSPAVFLLCEGSMTRFGVADSPDVDGLTGGELLKKFSGSYGNAGIQIIPEEEMAKYIHVGDIKAELFNS